MDECQSAYLELQGNKGQVVSLIFDEIGLAEMSLDNPLKVLHSYLDNASEDKSEDLAKLLRERVDIHPEFGSLTPQQ